MRGWLFVLGKGRSHRPVPRILLQVLLIRRCLMSRRVAWRSLICWSPIRSGHCGSGLSRRWVWVRGWLIRRVLGSRWVLGGMRFRVVVWMMCWMRSLRVRMWLRLKGLKVIRVCCLRWGRRVDRLRVEVVGASGVVVMVRVMTMRSLWRFLAIV